MKVIFELQVQDARLDVALQKARQSLRNIKKELTGLQEGDERFNDLAKAAGDAKNEIADLTKAQKDLNREFKATQVPKDSLAGLRLEYQKLTDQINKLSKAEREAAAGQQTILRANNLKGQIDQIEQSIGRFTGNVGNYRSALGGIGDLLTGGLITGGAVVGLQKFIEVMQLGISVANEYEQQLADLSALTGATGNDLQQLELIGQSLQEIDINGQTVVSTGSDILNSLKLVGGARPELLKDAAALGEVTKQAIILSKASGDTLENSVVALTTVLGQFDEKADASKRIINELAAGAKEGAAEIPQITDSLREFGTVAEISNIKTSESVALIEVLADRQLKGAEAGTQLRNVFAKLASADILPKPAQAQFAKLGIDINVLKDSTLPLEVRLRELGKAQGDLSALTKIFGLENLQAATIITDGIPKYVELEKKIQGTNEAYTQAATRADTANQAFENLQKSGVNSLQQEFSKLTPIIQFGAEAIQFLNDKLDLVGAAIDVAVGPLSFLLAEYQRWFGDTKGIAINQEKLGKELDIFGESLRVSTSKSQLYFQSLADGNFKAATLAKTLGTVGDKTEEEAEKAAKAAEEAKSAAEKAAKAREDFEKNNPAIGSLRQLRKAVQEAQEQLEKSTPGQLPQAVKVLNEANDALQDLEAEIKKLQSDPFTELLAPIANKKIELPLEVKAFFNAQSFEAEGIKQGINAVDELQKKATETRLEREKKAIQQAKDLSIQSFIDQGIERGKQREKDAEEAEKTAKEEAEKEKERRRQIRDASIEAAGQVAGSVLQIISNRQQKEFDQQLSNLDKEKEAQIAAANGNADQIAAIEKEFAKKKEAIEKEAAKKRQRQAIIEATINGAVAITKALTGGVPPVSLILAGLQAAVTAAQIAVIATQKFAKGGVLGFAKQGTFGGRPHSKGGTKGYFEDGTRVEVEADEDFIILNKRASAERRRLSALNYQFGGQRFETGGVVNFTPNLNTPNRNATAAQQVVVVQSGFTAEQVQEFARLVANETAAAVGQSSREAIGVGLEDANRRREREQALKTNRAA